MYEMDVGDEHGGAGDQRISITEFEVFFTRVLGSHVHRRGSLSARSGLGPVAQHQHHHNEHSQQHERLLPHADRPDAWANDCDEVEDEYADLTDAALLRKALAQLLLGAAIVTVFSGTYSPTTHHHTHTHRRTDVNQCCRANGVVDQRIC